MPKHPSWASDVILQILSTPCQFIRSQGFTIFVDLQILQGFEDGVMDAITSIVPSRVQFGNVKRWVYTPTMNTLCSCCTHCPLTTLRSPCWWARSTHNSKTVGWGEREAKYVLHKSTHLPIASHAHNISREHHQRHRHRPASLQI